MTRTRSLVRCEHGLYRGDCVVKSCPHWDGQESPFALEEQEPRKPRRRRREAQPGGES